MRMNQHESMEDRMAKFKKITWTEADVRCPFYKKDNNELRCISCEGFTEGVNINSKFKSLAQKDRHMGIFCAARFESCPVYRCTYDSKYREDEE